LCDVTRFLRHNVGQIFFIFYFILTKDEHKVEHKTIFDNFNTRYLHALAKLATAEGIEL